MVSRFIREVIDEDYKDYHVDYFYDVDFIINAMNDKLKQNEDLPTIKQIQKVTETVERENIFSSNLESN